MSPIIVASIIFSSVYLVTCIIRWYAILKIALFLGKDDNKKKSANYSEINIVEREKK